MSAARNDPCPCGSGRRFKHCCGAVQGVAASGSAAPGSPEVTKLVAVLEGGQLAQAESQAAARLAEEPGNGLLWKVLSVAQMRQGKDARAALTRAAALLPQDAEAQANLGGWLRRRGEWQGALESLGRSLALEHKNPDALTDAADAQRALGRPRDATTLYQTALQLEPGRVPAIIGLGNALLELGEPRQAVRWYDEALAVVPDDPQIQCHLSNALRLAGETTQSLHLTRRLLLRAPQLPMAHNNLGLLLMGQGEVTAAIASFRECVRLDPAQVSALLNLGGALKDTGQPSEALALYSRAVELDPRNADAQEDFGYMLLESRRMPQAEAAFRRALTLRETSARGHLGLAATLRVQGRAGEAEGSCARALELQPSNPEALALLGELHADRGRFPEARAQFERAIAAQPDFAAGYASIASLQRMRPDDEAWLTGATELLSRPLPVAQQAQLHFALGKYFDDVGRYDEAFGHFRQANELTLQGSAGYDSARLEALVERVMRLCPPDLMRTSAAAGTAPRSAQPIFIIGMPRSGTSLAEQILASHPDVFGAGEVRFWDRAFLVLEREAAAGAARLAQALPRVADDYLAELPAGSHAALRVTDKMPANFLYAGVIHAAMPRARFIHMQRHPLDTCLSIYFQNFFNVSPYANDFAGLKHYYSQYRRLMNYWRQVLPPGTLLEVPYEGLVSDAQLWTRRMLEFAQLPWDARCLEFYRTERVVITASRWPVRQKLHGGSRDRWRNYETHLGPLRPLLDLPA
jgi:tetratricopeptide (TPR) repeat protein